jgi:hypothetical protein
LRALKAIQSSQTNTLRYKLGRYGNMALLAIYNQYNV